MTGHEYQLLAARTINKDLTNKDCEMHALHGMVGEIGELLQCELFRQAHGIRQPRSNIRQMLECQMKHREKAGDAE